MTSRPSRQRSTPAVRQRERLNQEDVGYGRPPKAHQFKPGQSGNGRGRPKGAKNESTILRDLLNRKIEVRDRAGRVRKITRLEGILLRMTEESLRGNIKSAAFLLNRYGALVSGETDSSTISDDDREVLEAFLRRVDAERNGRR